MLGFLRVDREQGRLTMVAAASKKVHMNHIWQDYPNHGYSGGLGAHEVAQLMLNDQMKSVWKAAVFHNSSQ
jgi:hypothetical protein